MSFSSADSDINVGLEVRYLWNNFEPCLEVFTRGFDAVYYV